MARIHTWPAAQEPASSVQTTPPLFSLRTDLAYDEGVKRAAVGIILVFGFAPACARRAGAGARAGQDETAPPVAITANRSWEIKHDGARDGLTVATGTWPGHPFWMVTDLGVDLSRIRIEIAARAGGASLFQLLPKGALAIVNGGYFRPDFRPTGWVRSEDKDLSPKSPSTRGGVFGISAAGDVFIGPLPALPFVPRLAIQNFPLVVEAGSVSGIHSDDGHRAARTVLCIANAKLHILVVGGAGGDGPTLFEVAEHLRAPAPGGLGCTEALNLDGGPSTGVAFASGIDAPSREALAPVGYGLALFSK